MKSFGFEKVPGFVELNDAECCALEQGFKNNPRIKNQLADSVDKGRLDLYEDELANTANLGSRPKDKTVEDEAKTIYSQIAKAELARLVEVGDGFKCAHGHSSEEHKEALQSVVRKFSQPVN